MSDRDKNFKFRKQQKLQKMKSSLLVNDRKKAHKKSKKKSGITQSVMIVFFLIGLSLLLYPSFANWVNSRHSTYTVTSYRETVEKMDRTELDRMLQEAHEYNEILFRAAQGEVNDVGKVDYSKLMNISENHVLGSIEIPSIDVNLPIYKGTSADILLSGVGHLEVSSLPVGGESTHTVLTGHRGLPSALLFTRLDELKIGDIFILQVLGETLTYEVDQIRVVLPEEVKDLMIDPNEDLATLVTCTPYGVNTHRLLVRGHRISNLAEEVIAQGEANLISPMKISLWIGIPLIVLVVIYLLFFAKPKKDDLSELEEDDLL